ncbi:MAG: VaFE repeat-containing surface-anchored protein [Firmicutes bacterium]|nr:VaFE repeat-containing surface-anchored protein [Bacillota bacterium]
MREKRIISLLMALIMTLTVVLGVIPPQEAFADGTVTVQSVRNNANTWHNAFPRAFLLANDGRLALGFMYRYKKNSLAGTSRNNNAFAYTLSSTRAEVAEIFTVDGKIAYCFDINTPATQGTFEQSNTLAEAGINVTDEDLVMQVAEAAYALTKDNFQAIIDHAEELAKGISNVYGYTVPKDAVVEVLQSNSDVAVSFKRHIVQWMVWWKVNDYTFLDSTPQQTVSGGVDKEGNPLPDTTIPAYYGVSSIIDYPELFRWGLEKWGEIKAQAEYEWEYEYQIKPGQTITLTGIEGQRIWSLYKQDGYFGANDLVIARSGSNTTITAPVNVNKGEYDWQDIEPLTANIYSTKPYQEHDAGQFIVSVDAYMNGRAKIKVTLGMDPVGILLKKADAETGQNVPQGSASLEGAEYTIKYYEAETASGTPDRTWVFKTNANGFVRFEERSKVSGDELFYTDSGLPSIPEGTITIQETKAPVGYVINDEVITVYLRTQADGTVRAVDAGGNLVGTINQTNNVDDLDLTSSEMTVKHGSVSVQKVDKATGSAPLGMDLTGIQFTVELADDDRNAASVMVNGTAYSKGQVITTITTNASGFAKTADNILPYGYYTIRETVVPQSTGMVNSGWSTTVYVSEGTQALNADNPLVKGGVRFAKIDAVTGLAVTSGKGTLSGATIGIYPAGSDTPVLTIKTGSNGIASTDADALTFGKYYAKEIESSNGYLLNPDWRDEFDINENGVIVDRTENKLSEPPVYGGVKFSKIDWERNTNIPQGSASLESAEITIYNNSGKEIILKDGSKVADGGIAAVIKTNIAGTAQTAADALPYGDYYAVETKASEGYLLNDTWRKSFSVKENGVIVDATDSPLPETEISGSAAIVKIDLENNTAQGDASLAGIRFAIVNNSEEGVAFGKPVIANGSIVTIIETDENGKAAVPAKSLPYGTYTIYELKASSTAQQRDPWSDAAIGDSSDIYANNSGYLWRNNSKQITITTDGQVENVSFEDSPVKGGVKIEKWDAELDRKAAQGDADFSGIAFEIVNKSKAPVYVDGTKYEVGEVVATIEANAEGDASCSSILPYGTYEIKEVATNGAYRLTDGDARTFEIREHGAIVDATSANEFKNEVIRGGIEFLKVDAETDDTVPQGLATLEGAEITVYNNSDSVVVIDGIEIAVGDAVAVLTTDAEGRCGLDGTALPYGAYYAVETKASEGYLLSDWRIDFQIREDGVVIDASSDDYYIEKSEPLLKAASYERSGWFASTSNNAAKTEEQIKRADLRFRKVDIDGKPMAGIPFMISRLDAESNVVESHVIVSDADGIVDTSIRCKTDEKVNSLDEYVENGVFTNDAKLDKEAGIWYGEQSARNDDKGALIYAAYSITELQCKANLGQTMLTDTLFVDGEGVFTADFEDGRLYNLDNIFIDLIIHPESDLIDYNSQSKTITISQVCVLIDTVRYDHLKTDKTYKIVTEIYHEDRKGNTEKVGENAVSFRPAKTDETNTASGTIDIEIELDTTTINGGKLHAVDTFYLEDENEVMLVKHNAAMDDERQMVFVPALYTVAVNKDTELHLAASEGIVEITDTVSYEMLPNERTFTVEGTLRFADSGEVVTDSNGDPCVVTKQLTVSKRVDAVTERNGAVTGPLSGQFDMPTFSVRGEQLEGKTVVVTEVLYDFVTGEEYIRHYDLEDEDQSVHFPKITTEAADAETDAQIGQPRENVKIIDKVTYSNLIPGLKYSFYGKLMDKETEKPYLDDNGNEVTAELLDVEITEPDGYVELTFEFSGENLKGKTVVIFEDVKVEDETVAVHHDIEDESQSVDYPDGRTEAKDALTDARIGYPVEKAVIIDTFTYENLYVGYTYTVKGYLVDKESGEPILADGSRIEAQKTFTAEAKDGAVELTFELDASSLAGKTIVVFEDLYYDETTVIVHHDLEDEAQSVEIVQPEVKTTATDKDTGGHTGVAAEGTVTIVDVVRMTGLMPGNTFKLNAKLVDKTESTENALVYIDGATVEKEFTTPDDLTRDAEYEVTVEFNVDATLIRGECVVAFETLTFKDREIAVHADLSDKDQTVDYPAPKIATSAKNAYSDSKELTANVEGNCGIVDTITYENFVPGTKVVFRGILMDKATGKAFLDVNGKTVESESAAVEITAENGTATVTFFIEDFEKYDDVTLVVFEKAFLISGDEEIFIASHEDIDDEDQTVIIPSRPETPPEEVPPQTGDNSNIYLWAGLAVAAVAAGIAAAVGLRNKKDDQDDEGNAV